MYLVEEWKSGSETQNWPSSNGLIRRDSGLERLRQIRERIDTFALDERPLGVARFVLNNDDDDIVEVTFDDETPINSSNVMVTYQQVMKVFDDLTPADQQLLMALSIAFSRLSHDEKKLITAATEKLADL